MPTITSGYTYGGNRGSQWVMDAKGPRQWTLDEEAEIEVKSTAPDPVLQPADQEQHSDYEPKFGDYMLYVGLPDVRPYYIVKVISYDRDTDLLTFHYLHGPHAALESNHKHEAKETVSEGPSPTHDEVCSPLLIGP